MQERTKLHKDEIDKNKQALDHKEKELITKTDNLNNEITNNRAAHNAERAYRD